MANNNQGNQGNRGRGNQGNHGNQGNQGNRGRNYSRRSYHVDSGNSRDLSRVYETLDSYSLGFIANEYPQLSTLAMHTMFERFDVADTPIFRNVIARVANMEAKDAAYARAYEKYAGEVSRYNDAVSKATSDEEKKKIKKPEAPAEVQYTPEEEIAQRDLEETKKDCTKKYLALGGLKLNTLMSHYFPTAQFSSVAPETYKLLAKYGDQNIASLKDEGKEKVAKEAIINLAVHRARTRGHEYIADSIASEKFRGLEKLAVAA